MTVSPGEESPPDDSSHGSPGDPPADPQLDGALTGGDRADTTGWRSSPSDDDVDAAFAAIVSQMAREESWQERKDAGPASAAQRHPSAGGPVQETGAERARRRELRRLERAEEVAAYAAQQAEIEAERAADDAHFTPPDPPPLPRPRRRTVSAVLLIVAGLILLARPGLLAVSIEFTMVLAAGAILGGAYLLLIGIWRRRGGDGDDGAVV